MLPLYAWYKQQLPTPDDNVEVYSDSKDKRRWLESIDNHIALMKGNTTGLPLAYVTREEAPAVPDALAAETDYETVLRDSGRHTGAFWRADNEAVWLFLRSKCHKTSVWSCIEPFERRRNGRLAYIALNNELMGEAKLKGS